MQKFTIILVVAALLSPLFSKAQENNSKSVQKNQGKPNIPGVFVVEFGFNQPQNKDSLFSIGFWGSRTFNAYYQYEIRLFKSKLSFLPGLGFSLERYKLKNYGTLAYTTDDNTQVTTLDIVPSYQIYPSVRKSMIITNYLEVPLELRFMTRPEDPNRSFRASIGGRVGYLFDSFTKIKYKEDGEKKVIKDKQDFNMNKLRYGMFTKIGIGNFAVFGYYNITPLFKKNEGPHATEMQNMTIGISLSGF